MRNPEIRVSIRYGHYGEFSRAIAIPIAGELRTPVELSNDPLSLILASPGMAVYLFLLIPWPRFLVRDCTLRLDREFDPPFDRGVLCPTSLPSPFDTFPAFTIAARAAFRAVRFFT